MANILLVTTHNLATNPRLVKELGLFVENGHKVTVICFEFSNWSKPLNDIILKRFDTVSFHIIPANRKPLLPWLITSAVQKISKLLLFAFPSDAKIISYAYFKNSYRLKKTISKIDSRFDWVIAHNPGSFWVSKWYAGKNKIKLGIDMEDYHPGETINVFITKRIKTYLKKTLYAADYISAASPLILEYTLGDVKDYKGTTAVVLNSFRDKEFQEPVASHAKKIQLVWFSQHISFGRGLEQFCKVLDKYQDIFELHLYGKVNPYFFNKYLANGKNIFVHDPVPQTELHSLLSRFDIGLAIEPGKDLNNNLALSNKILAYAQAGVYILASDTFAQKKMLEDFPAIGMLTSLEEKKLENSLDYLQEQIGEIISRKTNRFKEGEIFSWENESKKILDIIQ